jgi:glycosyltransferase involved in cell wall biosynthesis
LRAELAQGAQALVARHSWRNVAAQYETLYAEILSERHAPGTR